ncbi:hypothetical protein RUM43_006027 [Polyplax serrata]|uniref:MYND-type domain-containing protein n=1 Tax=Polyplax serrata TaxID=468196 RepID=A0AAN8NSE2_POLSC
MDVQKELIEHILKNNVSRVKEILLAHNFKPDDCDENGMTPLQHAAFKGNKDIVQLLLDQGADVNSGKHEYSYTALHFAALSGSTDVCQLLLEHGAKTYSTNSVGRTASQMAAFVGNHACVTTINNFIPKSDVDYYCVPSGFEVEPKLPPLVAAPLHKFIMEVNLNPVKAAINLIKLPLLYDNIEKVKNVLELMSEKEMKRGLETNEIMSFKFHYLSRILEEIIKIRKQQNEETPSKEETSIHKPVETFIKRMLRSSDGTVQECQESTLKEIVRGFHNRECTIFQQMVCSLARDDSPSALSVITSIINGQRGFTEPDVASCATCGQEKVIKKCSQCKLVQYCDKDCQKHHWFVHKKFCMKAGSSGSNKQCKEKHVDVSKATSAVTAELKKLATS